MREGFEAGIEEVVAAVDSSFSSGFLSLVVVPFLKNSRDDTGAAYLTKMNFGQARKLWVQQGLGQMVFRAHLDWKQKYLLVVRRVVGRYLY